MYLIFVVLLFFAALLHYYPLTLLLAYREKKWRLYWLPRVFGGYAKPCRLSLPQAKRDATRSRGKRRRRQPSFRHIRHLLRQLRIEHLDFLFLPGRDGRLTCIFHARSGDIMRIVISSLLARR